MSVCTQCGRELPPARVESTCADCVAAQPVPAAPPESRSFLRQTPAHFNVTAVLIVLNVLVFVAMVLRGVSIMQPNSEQLLRWGANFGPLTLDHQWWRLLTAVFLHIGIVHLAVNMWCLWNLGSLAEDLYGSRAYLAVYILSGLAGSIASLGRNALVVSAGASGAIFGVAGALIATLYLAKLSAARHALRISLISLVVFAAYSIGYGFVKGGMDNGAHVGGLVAGLVMGAVLSRDFRAEG